MAGRKPPSPDASLRKADPRIGALEKQLAALEKANAKLQAEADRAAKLDKLLEQQQQSMDTLKKSKWKLHPGKSSKPTGNFNRFIIPDTHGCFVDKKALKSVLDDLETLGDSVGEVILLGDHLDCSGWLAKHHKMKTIQEARYTFEEDLDAANVLLDEIHKRSPASVKHYLEGNHEERIEAWCVETAAQNPRDAARLRSMHSPEAVLHLGQRNINYYRRVESHCGLRRNGIIKLGRCYFCHGTTHAKHAATIHLRQHKRCVVFGHTHRMQMDSTADVDTELAAWCPGCLCTLEPIYRHSGPTEWSHGYALQLVQQDGDFLHINVPIIDGRSYLVQLTGGAA